MRAIRLSFLALATTALMSVPALADRTPSPAGAEVYIVSPKDGAKVKSPVTVVFGLKGMGIAPAGIKFDNTGQNIAATPVIQQIKGRAYHTIYPFDVESEDAVWNVGK